MVAMPRSTIFLSQSTLTDLFTLVFVFVDDYFIRLESEGICQLPKLENQQGSYSEIMTISLVGELLKQRYIGDWFDFVKIEYRQLFPKLPDRSRFYRIYPKGHRQNNLERIFADFALRFPAQEQKEAGLHLIDSKPIPICKGARYRRPRAMTESSSGYSSLGWFYGFKLHAVVDEQGCFCRFLIAAAHVSDQEAGRALLAGSDALVLGDANYHGCGVHAHPKINFRHPKPWSSLFSWVRKTNELPRGKPRGIEVLTTPQTDLAVADATADTLPHPAVSHTSLLPPRSHASPLSP
jgi:hypothetical protein